MAQKLQVLLTCDLHEDAVEAAETVTFGYEGATYAFELCEEHLRDFRSTMGTWVGQARRTDEGPAFRPSGPSAAGGESGAIRTWARSAGFEVSERGRIPAEVRAAYEAAHRG